MLPGFDRMAQITRTAQPGLVSTFADFPHYFPLSFLPDSFWDYVDPGPIIRVTDQYMQEVPFQVVDFDAEAKTGALWFKGGVNASAKSWYVHWSTETEAAYESTDPFGSLNVWTGFRDVLHLNELPNDTDPAFARNSANGAIGNLNANPLNSTPIDSAIEQNALYFTDQDADNTREFSDPTFDKWTTPVTFLFLVKFLADDVDLAGGRNAVIINNYTKNLQGFRAFTFSFVFEPVPTGSYIFFEFGDSGLSPYGNSTAESELDDIVADAWYLVAVKFSAGADGVQIDVNKISRAMTEGEDVGVYPVDADSTVRTVGLSGNAIKTALSALMIYNGGLEKEHRDLFFDNWINPDEFWDVDMLVGPLVCVESQIDEEECLNSQIGA